MTTDTYIDQCPHDQSDLLEDVEPDEYGIRVIFRCRDGEHVFRGEHIQDGLWVPDFSEL